MKKLIALAFIISFITSQTYSQADSSKTKDAAAYIKEVLSFEKSIPYKTGKIALSDKIELNIPKGYKFIPQKEASIIISKYWGNPERDDVLGMLVQEKFQFLNAEDWAFILSEQTDGYVKDEDANKINYDDLLNEIKDSEEEENKERVKNGYDEMHIMRWASTPYYDSKSKILHWAKEIKFGKDSSENTLNYDVRILGREGLLSMNAVGVMSALDSVKKHIPQIINMAQFTKGHKYADFDEKSDNVAAYTIGGLVAGKLLAKAGLFALLLKNIKLLIFGGLALFSAFKNKILRLFGKKQEEIIYKETDSTTPNEE